MVKSTARESPKNYVRHFVYKKERSNYDNKQIEKIECITELLGKNGLVIGSNYVKSKRSNIFIYFHFLSELKSLIYVHALLDRLSNVNIVYRSLFNDAKHFYTYITIDSNIRIMIRKTCNQKLIC